MNRGKTIQSTIKLSLLAVLLLMLLAVVTVPANAASTVQSGTCGANLTWTLDSDGLLTISGSGAMTDYNSASGPWRSYNSTITSLTIGDSVTSIGGYAFCGCSGLTGSLTIPASVNSIGNAAFYGCNGLTGSLTIGDSVTSIGNSAFNGCNGFTGSLTIPASVTSIGSYAFYDCSGLTGSLTIPNSVTTIGNYAFFRCSGFTGSLTIGDSVTSIGDFAFEDCQVDCVEFLGNAPTTFGSDVFAGTPNGFFLCYHSDKTGWTLPTWGGYNSACIDAVITDYSTLDANCRNAQNLLFTLNEASQTATVGNGSTTNNNSGYYGAGGQAVIPDTVTKDGKTYRVIGVGQYAFKGSLALRSISLGANIQSLGLSAFSGCKYFTRFTVSADNTRYAALDGASL